MKRKRKNYTPEEKVIILKRHLVDRVPVSDLCDEYSLHPTVFYRWQKDFFEHGAAAFEKDPSAQKRKDAERIKVLEQKLQRKHEVLSELMEEHVKLKKNLGEI
ncbi:MAG: transposase [Desulfosporosinus sp.]|jgi:transposase-like protein|nr:transposase [Desulfosporosinus sp.]